VKQEVVVSIRIPGLGLRLGFVLGLIAGILIMAMLSTVFYFGITEKMKRQQILINQQKQLIQPCQQTHQKQIMLKMKYKMKRLNNARLP